MENEEKNVTSSQNQSVSNQQNKASKVGIGVALGLLGLIGLVIGLVLYNDEFEKKTFLKGWIIAFVIEIILGIILGVVISCSAVSIANNLYY